MPLIASEVLQSAALSFVLPWKELTGDLEVVSRKHPPENWKDLLAGQSIVACECDDLPPAGSVVFADFGQRDCQTEQDLTLWAGAVQKRLVPGGILIFTGIFPEAQPAGHKSPSPLRTTYLLSEAGFARCHILPYDWPYFAVVAQTPAQGRKFDAFSAAFLAPPPRPPEEITPLKEDMDFLNRRLEELRCEIAQLEHDAEERLKTYQNLNDQIHAQIAQQIAQLERLTRRRGLRKFLHDFKAKRRAKKAALEPKRTAPTLQSPDPQNPDPQNTAPSLGFTSTHADHVLDPLSIREDAVRAKIFKETE